MRLFRLGLLAVSLLPSCLAAAETAPALPEGVAPPSPEIEERLRGLLEKAEKVRGLAARYPVPSGVIGEAALQGKMNQALQEDLPPGEMKALEAGLKAFGLIPETLDLATYYPKLLSSQVAGYYDPERRYLALVRREGGLLGQGAGEAESAAEDMVLVHELVHALQDQHFDLRKFASADPMSDAATARAALVEGDATLAMMSYMTSAKVEEMPGIAEAMERWMRDPARVAASMPDMPGGAELARAPAFIRDNLLFGYFRGFTFSLDVKKRGGQKLLDYAFSTDPPRSSEQILHPEKWHGRRDDPVVLVWPDLSGALAGYGKSTEGELGEATLATLLREGMEDDAKATAAAAGWGGDRFAVYEKRGETNGRRLLVWLTEWDSEADAREAVAALKKLSGDWKVETLAPRRVLVTRGRLSKVERTALRAALAKAEAKAPANQAIDLGAFPKAP
jgi:hypothetical protein